MSENRQIARAAGLVGLLTLLSRIAGLLRDVAVGFFFGTGAAADAFFVAFRIPNLLRRFVAEGAMSVAFIPVFTDYITNRSRREAHEAVSAVATLMAIVLAALTLAGIVFAPQLTAVFAPGFADDASKFELTVRLTRWVFPFIFLVSLTALAASILNSLRHFAVPAMAPIFLNLSMIAAVLFVCPRLDVPVRGLAYGVVVGGFVQLALQIPPLVRRGFRVFPCWKPGHAAVRRSLGLMAPMVFGAAVYQINILLGTVLASLLPSGSVSYLWYADRVFEFPLGIFATALGTAALPSFSAPASRRAYDELSKSLSFSLRLTNFIAVPAATGIFILALPITSVLFQRGAFTHGQVVLTAHALSAFAVGLWSVSTVRVVVPAFYAVGDTRTPVVAAALAFFVNLLASLLLMGPVAPTGSSGFADSIAAVIRTVTVLDLRHVGLALATSISATVNLFLLLALLRRHLPSLSFGSVVPSLLRSLAASAAMIPFVQAVAALADWSTDGLSLRITVLGAAVTTGIAVFAIASFVLGSEEIRDAARMLRRRLLDRSAS
jgi:putative peptidoglycan lipid II flippase